MAVERKNKRETERERKKWMRLIRGRALKRGNETDLLTGAVMPWFCGPSPCPGIHPIFSIIWNPMFWTVSLKSWGNRGEKPRTSYEAGKDSGSRPLLKTTNEDVLSRPGREKLGETRFRWARASLNPRLRATWVDLRPPLHPVDPFSPCSRRGRAFCLLWWPGTFPWISRVRRAAGSRPDGACRARDKSASTPNPETKTHPPIITIVTRRNSFSSPARPTRSFGGEIRGIEKKRIA